MSNRDALLGGVKVEELPENEAHCLHPECRSASYLSSTPPARSALESVLCSEMSVPKHVTVVRT